VACASLVTRPTRILPPLLWRFRFDIALRSRLISAANTSGDITNSDLEHAGTVAHQDTLALQYDIREATLCTMTDNTTALSRELGPLNVMADALSRRWDLNDSQILLYFHTHSPQDGPWKLCLLRPKMS
jgi:hypothetical protein